MYAKEFEYNRDNKLIGVRVYEFDDEGNEINYKLLKSVDEFPDLPFGNDDFNDSQGWTLNGFSHEVSFNDATFIDGEYVFERVDTTHDDTYRGYIERELTNKTYFNEKGQMIKIEESGIYENFVLEFFYDDDGFVIKETVDRASALFPYMEKINVYTNHYNDKLGRFVKVLKYTRFDTFEETFYDYNRFGDLTNEYCINVKNKPTPVYDMQNLYIYNDEGNWISKRIILYGSLNRTLIREYGDFSDCFKEDIDDSEELLPWE